jgi:hypothetical protein
MSDCDYKGCKELAISCCMIVDVSGEVFNREFCKKHLKKMLWDENGVILEE